MAKVQLQASFNRDKYNVTLSWSLFLWVEEELYYVCSPALAIKDILGSKKYGLENVNVQLAL